MVWIWGVLVSFVLRSLLTFVVCPISNRWVLQFNSVQFSRSVMPNSLRPHKSQHARTPCPSPIPGVHSNSCPLSRWCHPAISSSVVPFSSCPQSLPESESFAMSQLFAWGGQNIGVSALSSFFQRTSRSLEELNYWLVSVCREARERQWQRKTSEKWENTMKSYWVLLSH